MFNKHILMHNNRDNRPLVDLSYWAQNTYNRVVSSTTDPETGVVTNTYEYQVMEEIPWTGINYLKSVRPTNMAHMFDGLYST
jgi:hypothetical protein